MSIAHFFLPFLWFDQLYHWSYFPVKLYPFDSFQTLSREIASFPMVPSLSLLHSLPQSFFFVCTYTILIHERHKLWSFAAGTEMFTSLGCKTSLSSSPLSISSPFLSTDHCVWSRGIIMEKVMLLCTKLKKEEFKLYLKSRIHMFWKKKGTISMQTFDGKRISLPSFFNFHSSLTKSSISLLTVSFFLPCMLRWCVSWKLHQTVTRGTTMSSGEKVIGIFCLKRETSVCNLQSLQWFRKGLPFDLLQ